MQELKNKIMRRLRPLAIVGLTLAASGFLFMQCDKQVASHETAGAELTEAAELRSNPLTAAPQNNLPDQNSEPSTQSNNTRAETTTQINKIYLDVYGLRAHGLNSPDIPYIRKAIELWNQIIGETFFVLNSATIGFKKPYTCNTNSKNVKIYIDFDFHVFTLLPTAEESRTRVENKANIMDQKNKVNEFLSSCGLKRLGQHEWYSPSSPLNYTIDSQIGRKNINIFINKRKNISIFESYDERERLNSLHLKEQLFLYLGTVFVLHKIKHSSNKIHKTINLETEGLSNIKNKQHFKDATLWWNQQFGYNIFNYVNFEDEQRIKLTSGSSSIPTSFVNIYQVQDDGSRMPYSELPRGTSSIVSSLFKDIIISAGLLYTVVENRNENVKEGQTCQLNGTLRHGDFDHRCDIHNRDDHVCTFHRSAYYRWSEFVCECICQPEVDRFQEKNLLRLGVMLALKMLNKDI